jgi:hypothetical protein
MRGGELSWPLGIEHCFCSSCRVSLWVKAMSEFQVTIKAFVGSLAWQLHYSLIQLFQTI